jgi:GT2 family glycosyltransferase
MTDVAIIVVNYGTGSQAVEAAISARASCRGNAKVVIVDNNSPSNGIDLVIKCLKDKDVPFYLHEDEKTKRENYNEQDIILLRSVINKGFGGGCNLGAEAAFDVFGPDKLWFVNPDTISAPRCGAVLASSCCEGSVVGPAIFAEGTTKLNALAVGKVRDWLARVDWEACMAEVSTVDLNKKAIGDAVHGSSFMISKEDWVNSAGLAEGYFLFFEEADLAYRLKRKANFLYIPGAAVIHTMGISSGSPKDGGKPTPQALFYFTRSRLLFTARWNPRKLWFIKIVVLLSALKWLLRCEAALSWSVLLGALNRTPNQGSFISSAHRG